MIKIVEHTEHHKGKLFKVSYQDKECSIVFSYHALERINKWQVNIDMVIETLLLPDEVLIGHGKRFIAQKVYGLHVLRCIYEYEEKLPILITVYFPYATRYYKGGGKHEDKILKRC